MRNLGVVVVVLAYFALHGNSVRSHKSTLATNNLSCGSSFSIVYENSRLSSTHNRPSVSLFQKH
ncbi:unnamed protein product [Arabidopsis thaliana]|nr:unnamed protein product [Arabidopsis thaliana]VYS46734.1 unnamed protein product [Arabidopsis thaliana]